MSSSTVNIAPERRTDKRPLPWSLWLRQIRAIFRLEIEKNFLGRRSILLYLLALIPSAFAEEIVEAVKTNLQRG